MEQWYYESAGQPAGPLDGAAVAAAVATGKLLPATLVWCPGMPGWQAAEYTSLWALFPQLSAEPPPLPGAACTTATTQQSAPPTGERAPIRPGPAARPAGSRASIDQLALVGSQSQTLQGIYRFWLGSVVVSLLLVVLVLICFLSREWEWRIIMLVITLLPLMVGLITACRLLYWYWDSIDGGRQKVAPYLAVGLCFVPLFSFFWIFIAVGTLARELNYFVRTRAVPVPACREGVALFYCALQFIVSVVNYVLLLGPWPSMISADRPHPLMLGIVLADLAIFLFLVWLLAHFQRRVVMILQWQANQVRPGSATPQKSAPRLRV